MVAPPDGIRRVFVVVIDGVRADSVPLFGMPQLERLMVAGAWSLAARTVAPSVTAAAMGSLLTGVSPEVHGLNHDRFTWPRPRQPLDPLPRVLGRRGVATQVHLARLPRAYKRLATGLAGFLGVDEVHVEGNGARDIVSAAQRAGVIEAPGLHLHHWPDADRAGHAHGWTSRAYVRALRELDDALGALLSAPLRDAGTVAVILADHGGGGAEFRNHASAHPHDRHIPIVLAGSRVVTGRLAPGKSLLDVPATVAWLLGGAVPAQWQGNPLLEAFFPAPEVGEGELALASLEAA
jgi:arylsulfatase A-like enzyme